MSAERRGKRSAVDRIALEVPGREGLMSFYPSSLCDGAKGPRGKGGLGVGGTSSTDRWEAGTHVEGNKA